MYNVHASDVQTAILKVIKLGLVCNLTQESPMQARIICVYLKTLFEIEERVGKPMSPKKRTRTCKR